ncbi:alpha/beta fold hydrolase [Microbacterium sp. nov. GSS16]|uniref:alpha/beta fold hydrolase n=1 Tax=Microbacterium sp. nov. GSS16 TaxID=3019890 RepID=UPI0023069FB8|nr:alpha/beta hydrolase [Microbacterium sp. nov. GSS16]WCD92690.1 alpha/beta hydrolase [Microbacterium sp. nov. GSS16]
MAALDRTLEQPGARLRFHDTGGTGVPVVLSHGAGMDHTSFLPQAEAIRNAGDRVILWDMRGHGESALAPGTRFSATDALDDLAALLDACGVDRAILIGHSLGGNLAQEFAKRHPDRVAGLVVIGSTWNAGPLSAMERFGLRLAAPTLAVIPASRLPRMMAQASAVHAEVVDGIERVFARMPKRMFIDVWRATVSFVDPDAGYRTPLPLGLIRGAADRTGNIATAMPRWAAHEGVQEHAIRGAGHVVMLDAPQSTSDALLAVLEGMRR